MAGRKQYRRIIVLALCMAVLFSIPVSAAQEPRFNLSFDSLNLQIGVSSNFVISLENAQGAGIANIEGLENFDVVSQSQSTSTSIINGDVTYREDLYYTIMPKKAGSFTFRANIRYNNQYYTTNELQVNVSEEPVNNSQQAQDLFVKTILSNSEAYLGEKVVITYELYTRYNIEGYGFTDYKAIDGVISKDMPEDRLKAEYVYLDGNKYAKYEVKQIIIDPIKSGVYTIPSSNFQVNVTTESSMGGGLSSFFSSSKPMYLMTEEKELTVKPLPSEGKPKDFSGIVGELQLAGNYSRTEINYGDSFTLRATASGSYNPDSLKKIISGEIPGLTVYETQKNAVESVENNQYHVQKDFEVILVPEITGAMDVSPISVSYFNPVTEKYETAEIPGVTIEVLGDMPTAIGNGGSPASAIETVKIDQVNYADTNAGYFTIRMKKEVVYGVLIGLAVLIVLIVVLLLALAKRKKHDSTLKSLYKQLMNTKDINEIYNLFSAMIKHCYKLSLKASSQSIIRSRLPDANLAAQVTDIMDYMESPKSRDEKSYVYLKDKIKGIYRLIIPLQ